MHLAAHCSARRLSYASTKRYTQSFAEAPYRAGSVPFSRLTAPTEETDFSADSALPALTRSHPDQLIVRCTRYASVPDLCDSDHKPVVATLEAEVPQIDVARRRTHARRLLTAFHSTVTELFVRSASFVKFRVVQQAFVFEGHSMLVVHMQNAQQHRCHHLRCKGIVLGPVFHAALVVMQAPHIHVESTVIALQGNCKSFVIKNQGNGDAFFTFRGADQRAHGSEASINGRKENELTPPVAIPAWVNVAPASGRIAARSSVEVTFAVNKTAASFLADDGGQSVVEVRLDLPRVHCKHE